MAQDKPNVTNCYRIVCSHIWKFYGHFERSNWFTHLWLHYCWFLCKPFEKLLMASLHIVKDNRAMGQNLWTTHHYNMGVIDGCTTIVIVQDWMRDSTFATHTPILTLGQDPSVSLFNAEYPFSLIFRYAGYSIAFNKKPLVSYTDVMSMGILSLCIKNWRKGVLSKRQYVTSWEWDLLGVGSVVFSVFFFYFLKNLKLSVQIWF